MKILKFFKKKTNKKGLTDTQRLSKQIKFSLHSILFGNTYENTDGLMGSVDPLIHLIQHREKDGILIIEITLSRPGILIGKRGKTIDTLEKKLSDRFDKSVKIHIHEFDPFQ